MQINKYKTVFDKCLYINLPKDNVSGNWQIQIRSKGQNQFNVIYTDGYTRIRKSKTVKGYNAIKHTIKGYVNDHTKRISSQN